MPLAHAMVEHFATLEGALCCARDKREHILVKTRVFCCNLSHG